jgi:hypothetical protein
MVYQLKNTKTDALINLDIAYNWSKLFPLDKAFVITKTFKYKYQFARYFRQHTGVCMAIADDVSRTIYDFCKNDEILLICNK